ncbi:Uncharacterised protein [Escherichia coli]|nr:Uncharacterised protein [Escherichia coli]
MTDLTTQQHLVKIVHDDACPQKGHGQSIKGSNGLHLHSIPRLLPLC